MRQIYLLFFYSFYGDNNTKIEWQIGKMSRQACIIDNVLIATRVILPFRNLNLELLYVVLIGLLDWELFFHIKYHLQPKLIKKYLGLSTVCKLQLKFEIGAFLNT